MYTKIISGFIIGFYIMNIVCPSIGYNFKGHNLTSKNEKKTNPTHLSFGYQVAIRALKNGTYYRCGGAIVSEYHVLTSAYCLTYRRTTTPVAPNAVQILGGATNMNSKNLQQFSVKKVMLHEIYNFKSTKYDIAVLKLAQKISFTPGKFRKLQLTSYAVKDNTTCHLSSWIRQYMNKTAIIFPEMALVDVYKVNDTTCAKSYNKTSIHSSTICFESKISPRNYCTGEVGAPLNCDGQLVGILSWRKHCRKNQNIPVIYSNILKLKTWILNKIKE